MIKMKLTCSFLVGLFLSLIPALAVVMGPIVVDDGGVLIRLKVSDTSTVLASLGSISEATLSIVDNDRDPSVVDDALGSLEDTPLDIPISTLLANDMDPDPNDVISLESVDLISFGGGMIEMLDPATVRYVPAAQSNGQDRFGYSIRDAAGHVASGSVFIEVSAVNDNPEMVVTRQVEIMVSGGGISL